MPKNFYHHGFPFVTVYKGDFMQRRMGIGMQGRLFQNNPLAARGPLNDEEMIYAVALSVISCPAGNNAWNMASFRTPVDMYRLISSRNSPRTQQFLCGEYSPDPLAAARRIVDAAARESIRLLTYWDHDYPSLLREIQWPPIVLYVKGEVIAQRAVAVVGARKSDGRSSSNARRIASDLAGRGFTVVSGMAIGIDREAHMGALDGKGRTVGVLANGIDIIYPWANRDLYRLIEETPGSALISEYPPGIIAGKWTFVRRNRIISGLCSATVVVKAGSRSGALITARHALEQDREVFACSGNSFDEEYAGCHHLIRNGAVLISSPDDIIDGLPLPVDTGKGDQAKTAEMQDEGGARRGKAAEEELPDTLEGRILKLLSFHDHEIDSIVRSVKGSPGEVNQAIVALELGGRIIRNGNIISRL
jgi:DNA processing protein